MILWTVLNKEMIKLQKLFSYCLEICPYFRICLVLVYFPHRILFCTKNFIISWNDKNFIQNSYLFLFLFIALNQTLESTNKLNNKCFQIYAQNRLEILWNLFYQMYFWMRKWKWKWNREFKNLEFESNALWI
jgi:hypothetical protein